MTKKVGVYTDGSAIPSRRSAEETEGWLLAAMSGGSCCLLLQLRGILMSSSQLCWHVHTHAHSLLKREILKEPGFLKNKQEN